MLILLYDSSEIGAHVLSEIGNLIYFSEDKEQKKMFSFVRALCIWVTIYFTSTLIRIWRFFSVSGSTFSPDPVYGSATLTEQRPRQESF